MLVICEYIGDCIYVHYIYIYMYVVYVCIQYA